MRILLDPTIASPLTAKTVFIEGQKVEGIVDSVSAGTMVVDGLTVRVPAGATILDLRSGCDLVNFSTIEAGDKVVYFGLSTIRGGLRGAGDPDRGVENRTGPGAGNETAKAGPLCPAF